MMARSDAVRLRPRLRNHRMLIRMDEGAGFVGGLSWSTDKGVVVELMNPGETENDASWAEICARSRTETWGDVSGRSHPKDSTTNPVMTLENKPAYSLIIQ